jgi:hypothetical protein
MGLSMVRVNRVRSDRGSTLRKAIRPCRSLTVFWIGVPVRVPVPTPPAVATTHAGSAPCSRWGCLFILVISVMLLGCLIRVKVGQVAVIVLACYAPRYLPRDLNITHLLGTSGAAP